MWDFTNETPFAADRSFLRDRDGAEVLVIAVKATFSIAPDGGTRVADEQVELDHSPTYEGEPGASSLRNETDFVLSKSATDVLVRGHAYAARGEPTIAVEARLRAGPVDKRIWVVGDRVWEKNIGGLSATAPEPFVRMPVVYERAFGGGAPRREHEGADLPRDGRNPVGTGFAVSRAGAVGMRMPNLEDPERRISSWRQRPAPVGLGPIDRSWSPRVELGGTYDERWRRERLPLVPLDFDPRFDQHAPADQQVAGHLRGGEPFELANLTPDRRLAFTLPEVPLRVASHVGGRTVRHEARLYTVLVEPDERRVILVFQAALPCHHTLHTLLDTTVSLRRSPR